MERVGRELTQHRAQRPSETEGMTLAVVEETISRLEEQQTGEVGSFGSHRTDAGTSRRVSATYSESEGTD